MSKVVKPGNHDGPKEERSVSRKDSKKLKSDAKTRRKSDVTPIEDSSSSAKLDKKRRKLKERAERLEQEGLALLAQAKEAAEAYDRLTLKASKPGNAEDSSDTSSDDDDDSSTSRSLVSDLGKNKKAIKVQEATVEAGVKAGKPKREVSKKRKAGLSSSSSSSDSSDSSEDELRKKKVKQAKKQKQETEDKKGKKDKKDKTKDKKDKENKKNKESKDDDSKSKTSGSGAAQNSEQWHVDELEGGSARQSKFFRLLGGKKAGASSGPVSSSAAGTSSSTRAEADIRRQFEEGMKMKEDGGSRRRGLGA